MLRSIGNPGIGNWALWSQHVQLILRRIVPSILNIAVTRASCSDTSSPSGFMVLPHLGQFGAGSSTHSSRGKRAGKASFGSATESPNSAHGTRLADIGNALLRRQIFELCPELIKLPLQLPGLAAEVHTPELVDLRFQPFDLVVPLRHFAMQLLVLYSDWQVIRGP